VRVTIHVGEALDRLRCLPSNSVHSICTSPPYWALRDYGHPDQLGLERTPREYIAKLVAILEEARRVLRHDGTLWLNLGDSYASGNAGGDVHTGFNKRWHGTPSDGKQAEHGDSRATARRAARGVPEGFKEKDLVMIPHRTAIALQEAGWWVRCDNVWHKQASMPESVDDRPSRSHEYVFLMSKSARYYYDADAVRETSSTADLRPRDRSESKINNTPGMHAHKGLTSNNYATRNLRSVWTINPQPFHGAHFAVMAPGVAEKCILAGTSAKGACGECGAPYRRLIEKGEAQLEQQRACGGDENGEYHGEAVKDYEGTGAQNASAVKARILAGMRERRTVGWEPTCEHKDAPIVPCVVLDPFGGAGTTALVADRLGRDAILIELHPDNAELARKRIAEEAPMFTTVSVVEATP
jgi:DNA modification methylase